MIARILVAALVSCDPALAALFTPPRSELGRHEVCTTPEPIEAVVPIGATIEALDPLDALGAAGGYDRFAVARLYRGARARLARAWTARGQTFEAQTFLTPCPDATLSRLNGGTMIITFRMTSSPQEGARR